MKKKSLCFLLAGIMVFGLCLSGCSGQVRKDPKEAVEKTVLNSLKVKAEDFSGLLEDGIKETDELNEFTLTFPEEAEEAYLYFMSAAYSKVKPEIASIDEKEGSYTARVTFDPLDLRLSAADTIDTYVGALKSADPAEALDGLLTEVKKELKKKPVYAEKLVYDFKVEKDGDSYKVSEKDIRKVMKNAVTEYMLPYETINGIMDERTYFQAYLDATLKGEFTEFMRYTGRTQEEAQKWYEGDGAFDPPSDMTEAYKGRFTEAYKNILKQSKYTVGIPKKTLDEWDYTVEVKTTPNLGIVKSWEEFQSNTYPDIDAASAAYVQCMEKYVASPVYGEEKVMQVDLSTESFLNSDGTSDIYVLINEICPVPE